MIKYKNFALQMIILFVLSIAILILNKLAGGAEVHGAHIFLTMPQTSSNALAVTMFLSELLAAALFIFILAKIFMHNVCDFIKQLTDHLEQVKLDVQSYRNSKKARKAAENQIR